MGSWKQVKLQITINKDDLLNNFEMSDSIVQVPVGLTYEGIRPFYINIMENRLITIVGKKESGKESFIRSLIDVIEARVKNIELFIFDDVVPRWSAYETDERTEFYSIGHESSESIFSELIQRLKTRMKNGLIGENIDTNWLIIIIESYETILEMSKNKGSLQIFKDIIETYNEMNIFTIFTNIPNNPIAYSSPEMLKLIKEYKNFVIFDDIGNIKVTDIPISVARRNQKALEKNDAYIVNESEIAKVRVLS